MQSRQARVLDLLDELINLAEGEIDMILSSEFDIVDYKFPEGKIASMLSVISCLKDICKT